MLFDDLHRSLGVVERRHQHLAAQHVRDADRVRLGIGVVAWPRRHRSPQAVVVHAVPATLELEHLVAASFCPRDTECEERRFGAGAGEVDLVGARARPDHLLGQPYRRLVQEVVGRALGQLLLHRGNDVRVGVPQQRWSRPQVVVDEVAPRDVHDVAAVPLGDDQIDFGRQHEQPQSPAREVAIGTLQQLGLRISDHHTRFWHVAQRTPR